MHSLAYLTWRHHVKVTPCVKHSTTQGFIVIIMTARENSSSLEKILSDENSSNECNLYESDVGEVSETGMDV